MKASLAKSSSLGPRGSPCFDAVRLALIELAEMGVSRYYPAGCFSAEKIFLDLNHHHDQDWHDCFGLHNVKLPSYKCFKNSGRHGAYTRRSQRRSSCSYRDRPLAGSRHYSKRSCGLSIFFNQGHTSSILVRSIIVPWFHDIAEL